MTEPVWITVHAAYAFNTLQIAAHGGGDGVRDRGLLESALSRPRSRWRFERADLPALAASYAHGIAKNHPFVDGNKRTAAVVCETFLRRNGLTIDTEDHEWYAAVLALAAGETSEDEFAAWLRDRTTPWS